MQGMQGNRDDEVDPKELADAMRVAENNLFPLLRALRSRGMRRMVLALVSEYADVADLVERGLVDMAKVDHIAKDWLHDAPLVAQYLMTFHLPSRTDVN